jgi:5-methylcytosine-specific restriction protein A
MPTAPVPLSAARGFRVRYARHALYSSARWRRFRSWYLERYPLCVHCRDQGRLRRAREIHHVHKLADGGSVFDVNNCRALCTPCHSRETFLGR